MHFYSGRPARLQSAAINKLELLGNGLIIAPERSNAPLQARELVTAAELVVDPPLRRGEQVWLAGLTTGHRMRRRQSTVTTATCAMTIAPATVPRFRAVHEEVRLALVSAHAVVLETLTYKTLTSGLLATTPRLSRPPWVDACLTCASVSLHRW